MNKKVYLFELDSVRNNDACIMIGLKALFDEIINNGNCVVISFNQLTDSRTFLSMLEKEYYFKILMYLFTHGHIKVSCYGEYKTASQYIQNAINNNLTNKVECFIFSALPVKSTHKYLLRIMLNALKNSDLSEFTKYQNEMNDEEVLQLYREIDNKGVVKQTEISPNEARKQLKLLKRFLHLILTISVNEISSNPAIEYDQTYTYFSLTQFLDVVINSLEYVIESDEVKKTWETTKQILSEINQKLQNTQNRSTWIDNIHKKMEEGVADMMPYMIALSTINLCYNYVVEHSMYGVSKHYDASALREGNASSFLNDFCNRLMAEIEAYNQNSDILLKCESTVFAHYTGTHPAWEQGIRVLENRANATKKMRKVDCVKDTVPIYESGYEKERKEQRRQNKRNICLKIFGAILSVLIIGFVNMVLSFAEDNVNMVFESILTLFAFVLLSSVVEYLFHIPDVIDCFKGIYVSIKDLVFVSSEKTVSYFNKSNFSSDAKEMLPKIKIKQIDISMELKKYISLFQKKKELFKESDTISIVDPTEQLEVIRDFEIRNNVHIGVAYESPYNSMVVDLVKDGNETYYPYERVIPTVSNGAVVAITKYKDKFVLLKQFRHALREEQIAFPRGYGQYDSKGNILADNENVVKEIEEELNGKIIKLPKYLGTVVADSGLSGNKVSVFSVELEEFSERIDYEGITGIVLMTESEIKEAIKNGNINDGFTIAALSLYNLNL